MAMVGGLPLEARVNDFSAANLTVTAARELFLGSVFVMALQVMFGGLYVAGRTIDIQAGYGLAMLVDPTSRVQTPLVGTLFALIAGMVFFGMNGHLELLRLMSASLQAIPLGAAGRRQIWCACAPSLPRCLSSVLGSGAASYWPCSWQTSPLP